MPKNKVFGQAVGGGGERMKGRTDEGTPGKGMLAGLRLRRGLASRTPEIC